MPGIVLSASLIFSCIHTLRAKSPVFPIMKIETGGTEWQCNLPKSPLANKQRPQRPASMPPIPFLIFRTHLKMVPLYFQRNPLGTVLKIHMLSPCLPQPTHAGSNTLGATGGLLISFKQDPQIVPTKAKSLEPLPSGVFVLLGVCFFFFF